MAVKPTPIYDEEIKIDFGKYVEMLVRQWQLIAACTAGLGILALAFSMLINFTTPSYQAIALVASSQTESNVNFGSTITSTSDIQAAQAAAAGAQYLYDRKARLQSFVSLVQNGDVANTVLQELGPKLNNKKGEPMTSASLLNVVKARLIPNTDTIEISATYSDPVIAAEIANDWSSAYVHQINDLYGDLTSGTPISVLQTQVDQYKKSYQDAQAALVDFIAQYKVDEYTRQIDQLTAINVELGKARIAVGDQQVGDDMTRFTQAYSDSRLVAELLDNAVTMRAAVNAGGEPAAISNALALTMLKTQIYAAFQGTNTLQVQNLPESLGANIASVKADGMVADLDAVIKTLKTRQVTLNTLIETLTSKIQNEDYLMNFTSTDNPIEKKIQENELNIQKLKSLISTDSSTLDELTRGRDLAWESYKALATKTTEMSVAAQTTGSVVIFGSPAIPPSDKLVHSRTNGVVATELGLVIGLVVALAYELWQNYKKRQPESIIKLLFVYAKNLFSKRSLKSQKEPQ